MITTIETLPEYQVGDIVIGKKGKFLITHILHIQVEDPVDTDVGPTITFKLIMQQLTNNEEN